MMCGSECGVCMMVRWLVWLNVLVFLSIIMMFSDLLRIFGNGCDGFRFSGDSIGMILLWK